MSDSNLTEKITDSINNIINKTKIFEKIDNLQFIIGSFTIFTSVIGITNIIINYSNRNMIKNNEEIINKNRYSVEDLLINNNKIYITFLENKINELENKLLTTLKEQKNEENILHEIKNLLIFNIQKKNCISASTSISSILLESPKNPLNSRQSNDLSINQEDLVEDNELINECYDNIPLNNIKKTINSNWFF